MRKVFSLAAGLAAVALAAAVTVPANAITGGTTTRNAGANVGVYAGSHCSGTLINLGMVLTAWHCLEKGTTGTIQWGHTTREKGKKISISTVKHENDLALIYLAEEIPYGDVEYPPLGTETPKVGETVQFFGFGKDDSGELSRVLRTGSAAVIPPLNNGWADAYGGPSWTIKQNGNGITAGGDSGGGAFLNGKLVGVTSNGTGEVTNFVSIADHMAFLNEELR